MHARQTIREAIATILRTSPTNWVSVLETRVVPSRQIWPFLMVHPTDEQESPILIHPSNIYDRTLNISIIGMLKMPGTGDGTGNTETIEDRMDAVAAEIETKLTNTTLRASVSLVKELYLVNTSMDVVTNEEDGSISHATLTQSWTVRYHTAEGSPETLI